MINNKKESYTIDVSQNPKAAALAILNHEVVETTQKPNPKLLTIQKNAANDLLPQIKKDGAEMLSGVFPALVLSFLLVLKRELTVGNYLPSEPTVRLLFVFSAIALLATSAFATHKVEQHRAKKKMKQDIQLKKLQTQLSGDEETQQEFDALLSMPENEALLYMAANITRYSGIMFFMFLFSAILPTDFIKDPRNTDLGNVATLAISLMGLYAVSSIVALKTMFQYENRILSYFEGKAKKKESDVEGDENRNLDRLIDDRPEESLSCDESSLQKINSLNLS